MQCRQKLLRMSRATTGRLLNARVPPGTKTIQAIWSFKRKIFPGGCLLNHKAGICVHGGMQQWSKNYWETYSPVVIMLIVRLLIALCHIHGLESKSIDFVLAFPQADLDVDIWIELSLGFCGGRLCH